MLVFLGFMAFAVDVGHWYLVREQTQKAADAAALAGVVNLPTSLASAQGRAEELARLNGFAPSTTTTVASAQVPGKPTQLRVTVSTTVTNFFTGLFGVATTTITSVGQADYTGPVKMGSPCNRFGDDPDRTSSACSGVSGHFWANVNAPGTDKANGDPFLSKTCSTVGTDQCTRGGNDQYSADGYYYNVDTKAAGVAIQLFDPVWVNVGGRCDTSDPGGSVAWSGRNPATASTTIVTDAATRYAQGLANGYCTGDSSLAASTGIMTTTFTVLQSDGGTDPRTYLPVTGCSKTYGGYQGPLFDLVDKGGAAYAANPAVVRAFRNWVQLCTLPQAGHYVVQVQTSNDLANAGNRFSIRASGAAADTTISGHENMGMYANSPDADGTTEFYLARIPSSTAGQSLVVKLFDVGDSTGQDGRIQIVNPSTNAAFVTCDSSGVARYATGTRAPCTFTVPAVTTAPSPFNGKWVTITIPIATTYTCDDANASACWVKLRYVYGTTAKPTDVTSWSASMDGQPVRLVR